MMTSCRAYTGPAHGQRWTLLTDQPPDRVELEMDGHPSSTYRLLRLHASGPVRDRTGSVVYLPVRPDSNAPLPTSTGRRAYDEKVGNDDTG